MTFKRLFFASLATLLFFGVSAHAQTDPGIRDTIKVDNIQVNQGDQFPLTVRIFNDEGLNGATVGIRWGDPDLFLDSVSFAGSILEALPVFQRPVTIDNATNHEVLTGFFLFGGAPIPPSADIWATLWFTASATAPDKIVPFDSAKVGPAGDFILIDAATNASIVPEYLAGSVTIGTPSTNTAPVLNPIGPQTVAEGANLNFLVTATDAESVPTLSASPLANATFTDNGDGTGTFDFNPDFTQAGTFNVTFVASDGELSDSEVVAITVTNTNRSPVWATTPAQTVNEGEVLTFGVSATDPDGDALTLSAPNLPLNASFVDSGNGAGAVTFTPDFTQANVYTFKFVADDAPGPTLAAGVRATDTLTVQVTVNNVNRAPVWDPVAAQTVDEGQVLAFGVTSSDPDPLQDPTLRALSLPTNATFTDDGAGDGFVRFAPDFTQAGTYQIILEASDGSLTDTLIIDVTVNNVNRAPVIAAVNDTSVQVGQTLSLTISATDPDSDSLTLGSSILLNSTFTDNGDGTASFSFTPDASQVGAVTVTWTVSDGSLSDSTGATITVTAAPPVLGSISPDTLFFTITEGTIVVVTDCGFLTSTNAPESYTAAVVSGSDPIFTTLVDSAGLTDDSVCVNVAAGALTPGVYHNTVAYTINGIDNNPVDLVTQLTVEPAPTTDSAFVTPDTLWFTTVEGSGDIFSSSAYLTSTNAPAPYIASASGSPLFTALISDTGTTDDSVRFNVNCTGLTPGVFYNTVTINVTGVVNNPVSFVNCLTVEPMAVDTSILALSDSLFMFTSSVDTPFIGGDSLLISNAGPGPDFGWSITNISCTYAPCTPADTGCLGPAVIIPIDPDSSGITVAPLSGTTPAYTFINVDNQNLAPGTYTCVFTVAADSGVQSSPQEFTVEFVVNRAPQQPTSVMALSNTLFEHTVVAGEPNVITDVLDIFNTGDGPDFSWHINLDSAYCLFVPFCPPEIPFCGDTIRFSAADFGIFAPASGVTPSTLIARVSTDTLLPGDYWCFMDVAADSANVENSPQRVSAHLKVLPPPKGPSTDTLFVSTVPATPGSKVKVPVNLINNGPVCKLDIPLMWASSQIFLDSVSFAGTRLDGIAKSDYTVDNGARKVTITFDAVNLALPVGSGRIAYMFFDVFSGITDGGLVPIDRAGAVTESDCVTDGQAPEFFPGGIVIDSSGNVICGRVIDTAGNEIPGATVQIWDNFPNGTLFAEDTTLLDGSFKFNELFVVPYTVYGYAEGYYPATLKDINFGVLGLEVVLTPVSPVQPTNEWVEFYCDANTYMGVPLPVGSVIDAFDPDGDHVGTWFVSETGKYGFMPVYRDDAFTEVDDGADPGDTITLYINGMPAEATGDRVWTQNGDRFEVCLNFDGSVDKTFELRDGWNLISWNLDTDVDDIASIFGPIMDRIDVILSFEEVGLTYDPALPDFSTLTSADHLHGYWVRILPAGDSGFTPLTVTGLPALVNTPIHLEAGWNLVSYLPPVSLPTPSALVSQEGNLRVALGFDGGAQTYEPSLPGFSTLNTMAPCFGYWLKVFDPSVLIYPGFNSAPFIETDGDAAGGALARLGVANELAPTGTWMDIYAKELTLDGAPVNSGTEIRIVDANGALVGYGRTSLGGKLMFTPVYGASTKNESGLHSGEQFSLLVDGKATNETFTFGERGERLEVGALSLREGADGVTLPTDFNLSQNYPNPFNPSTKISFSLPKASEVTLEVFNVLGKRVALLASGFHEAGESTVTWDAVTDDGQPVASGMYFYRLKAGAFSQTRKMVLLK